MKIAGEDKWVGGPNTGVGVRYMEKVFTPVDSNFLEITNSTTTSLSNSASTTTITIQFTGQHFLTQIKTIGFGQLVWNKNIKKNELLIGIAYRLSYYHDDTKVLLDRNKAHTTHLPGVFIQNQINFNANN